MNDENPYASPEPTQEDAIRAAALIPQSFGQALRQGLKYGFKWGSVIALVLMLFLLVLVLESDPRGIYGIPWFKLILLMLGGYCFSCVIGIFSGVVIASLAYLVRTALNMLRRR